MEQWVDIQMHYRALEESEEDCESQPLWWTLYWEYCQALSIADNLGLLQWLMQAWSFTHFAKKNFSKKQHLYWGVTKPYAPILQWTQVHFFLCMTILHLTRSKKCQVSFRKTMCKCLTGLGTRQILTQLRTVGHTWKESCRNVTHLQFQASKKLCTKYGKLKWIGGI